MRGGAWLVGGPVPSRDGEPATTGRVVRRRTVPPSMRPQSAARSDRPASRRDSRDAASASPSDAWRWPACCAAAPVPRPTGAIPPTGCCTRTVRVRPAVSRASRPPTTVPIRPTGQRRRRGSEPSRPRSRPRAGSVCATTASRRSPLRSAARSSVVRPSPVPGWLSKRDGRERTSRRPAPASRRRPARRPRGRATIARRNAAADDVGEPVERVQVGTTARR